MYDFDKANYYHFFDAPAGDKVGKNLDDDVFYDYGVLFDHSVKRVHVREVYNLLRLISDMGSFFAALLAPMAILAKFLNKNYLYNKI